MLNLKINSRINMENIVSALVNEGYEVRIVAVYKEWPRENSIDYYDLEVNQKLTSEQ